jgi:Holliday junction resolvase RusA-like endonuclease
VTLILAIPGEPQAQGRGRAAVVNGHARIYDPKGSREWKGAAAWTMRQAMGETPLFSVALEVEITAYFSCPKSDEKKRAPRARRWHAKKPDPDNVAKAVLDAGLGVIWRDDSQISRLIVTKIIAAQGEAPRVEIRVLALEETR